MSKIKKKIKTQGNNLKTQGENSKSQQFQYHWVPEKRPKKAPEIMAKLYYIPLRNLIELTRFS